MAIETYTIILHEMVERKYQYDRSSELHFLLFGTSILYSEYIESLYNLADTNLIIRKSDIHIKNFWFLTPFGETLYNSVFKYNDYLRTNKLIEAMVKFYI